MLQAHTASPHAFVVQQSVNQSCTHVLPMLMVDVQQRQGEQGIKRS